MCRIRVQNGNLWINGIHFTFVDRNVKYSIGLNNERSLIRLQAYSMFTNHFRHCNGQVQHTLNIGHNEPMELFPFELAFFSFHSKLHISFGERVGNVCLHSIDRLQEKRVANKHLFAPQVITPNVWQWKLKPIELNWLLKSVKNNKHRDCVSFFCMCVCFKSIQF